MPENSNLPSPSHNGVKIDVSGKLIGMYVKNNGCVIEQFA